VLSAGWRSSSLSEFPAVSRACNSKSWSIISVKTVSHSTTMITTGGTQMPSTGHIRKWNVTNKFYDETLSRIRERQ